MRFCPTKAFFLCLTALPILSVLTSLIGVKATGPCGPMQSESCVQLALTDLNTTHVQQLCTALHWDFLFIPIYTLAISVLCFIVARIAKLPVELTQVIILLVVLGMPVDASENFTLIHIIKTHDEAWATTACWLGVLKYVLPSLGILYAIGAGIWGFVNVDK